MHAEVVPVPELFEGSIPFRDMLREPSCLSNLIHTPPVCAVAAPARVGCFFCRAAHVVQATQLMPRVTACDCDPDRTPQLLQHDGVRAPLLIAVGEGGDGEARCAQHRLSSKDFENLLKVLVDFPNPHRAEGYHLPLEDSVPTSQYHVDR